MTLPDAQLLIRRRTDAGVVLAECAVRVLVNACSESVAGPCTTVPSMYQQRVTPGWSMLTQSVGPTVIRVIDVPSSGGRSLVARSATQCRRRAGVPPQNSLWSGVGSLIRAQAPRPIVASARSAPARRARCVLTLAARSRVVRRRPKAHRSGGRSRTSSAARSRFGGVGHGGQGTAPTEAGAEMNPSFCEGLSERAGTDRLDVQLRTTAVKFENVGVLSAIVGPAPLHEHEIVATACVEPAACQATDLVVALAAIERARVSDAIESFPWPPLNVPAKFGNGSRCRRPGHRRTCR